MLQGDREAELGLHVTPFCDRRTVVVSASQLRFVGMFLEPMLPHVGWAVGGRLCRSLRTGLAATVAHWTEHAARVAAHSAHPHRASLAQPPPPQAGAPEPAVLALAAPT